MVLVNHFKYFLVFFFRSNTPKKVVHYVPDKKKKRGKIFNFAKGLVHGFGQKFPFFYPVFFGSNRPIKGLS